MWTKVDTEHIDRTTKLLVSSTQTVELFVCGEKEIEGVPNSAQEVSGCHFPK